MTVVRYLKKIHLVQGRGGDCDLLSIYTFCFLRNKALISCTLAANPRWTFFAASTAWAVGTLGNEGSLRPSDGGNVCTPLAGTSGFTRWIKLWHCRKSYI